MSRKEKQVPMVFISSTVSDLDAYRDRAAEAARGAGFLAVLCEDWAAADVRPPLEECLRRVDEADLMVTIVAHRCGWVPGAQAADAKSITRLECEHAEDKGKEVLAFVVDEEADWPEESRDDYELTASLRSDRPVASEDLVRVQERKACLSAFKSWLKDRANCKTFVSPENLHRLVSEALREWRDRHPQFVPAAAPASERAGNPSRYLQELRDACAHIDIRGLQVGSGQAQRFGIEHLYVPLATSAPAKGEEADGLRGREDREVPLQEALAERRRVIIGDPGAGKTTFLRRIGFALSQDLLGEVPGAARTRLELGSAPLPIYVRLSELAKHIAGAREPAGVRRPPTKDAPGWLPHFLAALSEDRGWGLAESDFQARLEAGDCLVMLDGHADSWGLRGHVLERLPIRPAEHRRAVAGRDRPSLA